MSKKYNKLGNGTITGRAKPKWNKEEAKKRALEKERANQKVILDSVVDFMNKKIYIKQSTSDDQIVEKANSSAASISKKAWKTSDINLHNRKGKDLSNYKVSFFDESKIDSIRKIRENDKTFEYTNFLNEWNKNKISSIYDNFILGDLIKYVDESKIKYVDFENYNKERIIRILVEKWGNRINYENGEIIYFRLNKDKFKDKEYDQDYLESIRIFALIDNNKKTIKYILLDHYHLLMTTSKGDMSQEELFYKTIKEHETNNTSHKDMACIQGFLQRSTP